MGTVKLSDNRGDKLPYAVFNTICITNILGWPQTEIR